MGNLSHTTGNVGIGNALASTIPGVLTVTDTTNTTKAAFGTNAANSLNFIQGGGDYMAIGYNLRHTGTNNTWNYAGNGNEFASLLRWQQGGFEFWGTSTQGVAPNAASLTNFLSIKNSGNVGIGTDAPTVKLDVNGGVKISGVLNVNEISGFTASGGIKFPPTAVNSADVNTLDDYEEGTWTPSLTFGGGTPTTLTYNTGSGGGAWARSGVYVKIGRLVWCHGRIQLLALSGANGIVRITGLPFAASYPTSVHPVGTVVYYRNFAAAITTPPGLYFDASDTIRFVKNSGGSVVDMASADFTAATDIMFSFIYGV